MTTPCDCPFCVLTNANLQICDLRVTLTPKPGVNDGFKVKWDMPEPQTDVSASADIRSAIFSLILRLHDASRIKVGEHFDDVGGKYDLHISRLTRNTYKFCFHAKMEPVPEMD